MTSLSRAGFNAATELEINRVRRALAKRQSRRTRSQFLTVEPPVFNAVEGIVEVKLSGGGQAYTQRITNSALAGRAAVSLPQGRTVGFVDAKPVSS